MNSKCNLQCKLDFLQCFHKGSSYLRGSPSSTQHNQRPRVPTLRQALSAMPTSHVLFQQRCEVSPRSPPISLMRKQR